MIDVEFKYNRYREVNRQDGAVSDEGSESRLMEPYIARGVVSYYTESAAKLAIAAAKDDPTCISTRILSMAAPR